MAMPLSLLGMRTPGVPTPEDALLRKEPGDRGESETMQLSLT